MNIRALRAFDRWVGQTVCRLLTLHRRLTEDAGSVMASPVGRILFVKLAEQGSTVLARRALASAIARVGRDNVFFVAFEENRFILDVLGVLPPDNILAIDSTSLASVARTSARVLVELRRHRVDAAIDLEFFSRSSAILCYLSGATRRVGLHAYSGEGPDRGDLMTHRIAYNPYLHTEDLFRLMTDALDLAADRFPAWPVSPPAVSDEPPPGPGYVPCREELAALASMLTMATGLASVPPLILLNANCGDLLPLRRWDGGRYVELAKRLLDSNPGWYVAFTGNAAEAAEAECLSAAVSSPRCMSLAGRTTLSQLLALFSLARVLVTNDSGPAHFAALTPIEVVTLFGPETPALFAARTARNQVIWAGLACSPCVSASNNRLSTCRDNVCMQRITVNEVVRACEEAMRRASQASRA